MACPSAANWNTSTAARWRTPWRDAPTSCRTGLSGRPLLVEAKQTPVAFVAAGGHLLSHDRGAYGATGLLHMPAILEAAIGAEPVDLDEAALRRAHQARRRREIANTRCIDDRRSLLHCVPARRGGRMPALDVTGQLGCLRRGLRDQGIHQR